MLYKIPNIAPGADLREAYLQDAHLEGEILEGVYIDCAHLTAKNIKL